MNETTTDLVPAGEAVGTVRPLVACDPGEMARAQGSLRSWATAKRGEVEGELVELRSALDIAVRNKWGTRRVLASQITRAERRVEFYAKVSAALDAGFLIVPNFAMDVFAIRTKARAPRGGWTQSDWRARRGQEPQLLPAGAGGYVGPVPALERSTESVRNGKGELVERHSYMPVEWRDVDFPVEMALPVVMERTEAALRLKLFDEIGIAKDAQAVRRGDPMILGRLRNPRPNRPAATFFIAWSFDPTSL